MKDCIVCSDDDDKNKDPAYAKEHKKVMEDLYYVSRQVCYPTKYQKRYCNYVKSARGEPSERDIARKPVSVETGTKIGEEKQDSKN